MSFIIENGELREYIPSGETDIVIPEGVTSIGNHAFSWCRNLRSATIPESVTSIGDYAFNGCGLQSITIPDSITFIGYGAFSNIKIMFRSKGFQVSFSIKEWGLNGDERFLARFYNVPIYSNFEKIRLTCYKYPMALLRFFGYDEDRYRKYIKRNIIKIAKCLIDENNYELMDLILAESFVTKRSIDKFINHSVEKKQTEITALLLDYKSKHIGFTDINKRFRL